MEAPSNEAEIGPETGSNIRSRFWPPYCDITRTLGWQSFTRSTIQTKAEEKRISWKWKMPSRSDEHGVNKKNKSRNYRNAKKKSNIEDNNGKQTIHNTAKKENTNQVARLSPNGSDENLRLPTMTISSEHLLWYPRTPWAMLVVNMILHAP